MSALPQPRTISSNLFVNGVKRDWGRLTKTVTLRDMVKRHMSMCLDDYENGEDPLKVRGICDKITEITTRAVEDVHSLDTDRRVLAWFNYVTRIDERYGFVGNPVSLELHDAARVLDRVKQGYRELCEARAMGTIDDNTFEQILPLYEEIAKTASRKYENARMAFENEPGAIESAAVATERHMVEGMARHAQRSANEAPEYKVILLESPPIPSERRTVVDEADPSDRESPDHNAQNEWEAHMKAVLQRVGDLSIADEAAVASKVVDDNPPVVKPRRRRGFRCTPEQRAIMLELSRRREEEEREKRRMLAQQRSAAAARRLSDFAAGVPPPTYAIFRKKERRRRARAGLSEPFFPAGMGDCEVNRSREH